MSFLFDVHVSPYMLFSMTVYLGASDGLGKSSRTSHVILSA